MEASSRAALAQVRERLAATQRLPSGRTARRRPLLAPGRRAVRRRPAARRAAHAAPGAVRPVGQARRPGGAGPPAVRRRKVSATALDLVETVARQRWSRPIDLVDGVDDPGDRGVAGRRGRPRRARRASRTSCSGSAASSAATASSPASSATARRRAEGKAALLDRLLSGRVSPVTEQLLRNVLTGPHVGHAENAIERLSDVASRRRGQSVARVTTRRARSTAAQEQRLTEVLGRLYGRTDRAAGDRRPERARRPGRPGRRRGHRRQHRPSTRSRRTAAGRLTAQPPTRPPTPDTTPQGRGRQPWPS